MDLRITVLALPPVITLIHRSLRISESEVGLLTGMVPLLLAAAAVPGSLLISRLGARRAVVVGLVVTAIAGALRGVGPSIAVLFLMTLVMGLGIAAIQPAYPALARQWFPSAVGFATAVYANGLLMGEVFPAALTLPLLLPLVGQNWQLSFAVWSIPVLATAVLVGFTKPTGGAAAEPPPARWWPDFGNARTWLLGFIFGGASALYWAGNAFVPDYLHATGRAGLVAASLTSLNLCQIPASVLIGIFAGRLIGRRWPFVAAAVLAAAGVVGFLTMPGLWAVVWAGSFGFTGGAILVLILALPPLLAAPDDVPRLAAGIFTISYTCSFLGPVLGGLAWDVTGRPAAAFVVAAAAAVVIGVLALRLDLPRPDHVPEMTAVS